MIYNILCREQQKSKGYHFIQRGINVVILSSLPDCRLTTPALRAAQSKSFDVLLYLVAEHSSRIDLLRYDANGDCVLNYLSDFEEDFFNIVLEAAARQKQVGTPLNCVSSNIVLLINLSFTPHTPSKYICILQTI